jgi:hypothetical protein
MPYTMEDYKREVKERILKELTVEERLEVVQALPVDKVIKAVPLDEVIKAVPPEKRLQGLSDEEIEALFQKFQERKKQE